MRYVDDFILLDRSPERLNAALANIESFLPERLGVHLNPRKTVMQPIDRGVDFVGHVINPWHRTTRDRTVRVALQRLRSMPSDDLFSAANSYLGLLRQASHSHHDRAQLVNLLRDRGHSVKADLTKVFRRNKSTKGR